MTQHWDTDGEGNRILLVKRDDGTCVGNFRLIGKLGHHADLAFRFYQNGPKEIRFPMADAWPTELETQRIVDKYIEAE